MMIGLSPLEQGGLACCRDEYQQDTDAYELPWLNGRMNLHTPDVNQDARSDTGKDEAHQIDEDEGEHPASRMPGEGTDGGRPVDDETPHSPQRGNPQRDHRDQGERGRGRAGND